jgi:hypothetical protein
MVMQKVGGIASRSGTPGAYQVILARISMWDVWARQRLFNRGFSIVALQSVAVQSVIVSTDGFPAGGW